MSTSTAPGRQPTILLVEDNEILRDALACCLVHEGYLVMTAVGGHDAINHLRTPLAPIDAVILDINLPDVSGVDLCSRLRELYPSMPVIVCSGEADRSQKAELFRLGIQRYLAKPVAVAELLAALEDAMLCART